MKELTIKNLIKKIKSVLYSEEFRICSGENGNVLAIKPDPEFNFEKLSKRRIRKLYKQVEELHPKFNFDFEFDIVDTIVFSDKKKAILQQLNKTLNREKSQNYWRK